MQKLRLLFPQNARHKIRVKNLPLNVFFHFPSYCLKVANSVPFFYRKRQTRIDRQYNWTDNDSDWCHYYFSVKGWFSSIDLIASELLWSLMNPFFESLRNNGCGIFLYHHKIIKRKNNGRIARKKQWELPAVLCIWSIF
jgi:hypothetical protein